MGARVALVGLVACRKVVHGTATGDRREAGVNDEDMGAAQMRGAGGKQLEFLQR